MRASGIIMHISSLPSPYGIGTLGKEARRFADFLASAGQKYWQLLPMNPTGFGDSPYQALSTFAGNHYFIDLDTLVTEGLLHEDELDQSWGSDPGRVDFELLYHQRLAVLREACATHLLVRALYLARLNVLPSHEAHGVVEQQIALGLALADQQHGILRGQVLARKPVVVHVIKDIYIVNKNR